MPEYEIGFEDLVGEDVEIGAVRRVSKKVPTKEREIVIGFDSVAAIAAGASQNIISAPQVPFRPERLVIPATIAASFLVNTLTVGKDSQFGNANPVPAEAFSQAAYGVRLKLDTAQTNQNVSMNVTNTSAGALRFTAALFGPSLQ